jgi:hypothetical protein
LDAAERGGLLAKLIGEWRTVAARARSRRTSRHSVAPQFRMPRASQHSETGRLLKRTALVGVT